MSRIGSRILDVPNGVEIDWSKGNLLTVKGPKGELKEQIHPDLELKMEDNQLELMRPSDSKRHKTFQGLYNSLIENMLTGVSEGYYKELELIGVGYRANNTGNLLELNVGFSHSIYFMVPDELKLETKTEKGKTPKIILTGVDKQLIGQVAAKIKSFRKTEPYKGKGINFVGEHIRRKAGKTAAK